MSSEQDLSKTTRQDQGEQTQHIHIETIEEAFTAARPRLARLATARGVASEAVEDVIQETLFEAWQYLERLQDPALFHVWLDGICRNVCRRWQQKQQRTNRHQTSLPQSIQWSAVLEK
jgi:DNA-directed RNA polymerase specialized sigma24 family protein